MQPSNVLYEACSPMSTDLIEVLHKGFVVSKVSIPFLRALLHPGQAGYVRLIVVLQLGHYLAQVPKGGLQGPCATL